MTTSQSTPTAHPTDATPQDAPLDQPVVLPQDPAAASAPESTDCASRSWSVPPAFMAAVPMIATGLFLLTHSWVFFLMIPAVMMLGRGGCFGGRR
ncbi:hypothetical protein [Lapillicoccus jejuensis]|uniref:Uncharacterized protein n=1 Tax=Lapillicoccus jejuensis TaxID=402171 RepID=A0A542E3C6_9MICO|nr:hypothetical protein [Lapillicoccus jejuensis]TQJ09744.1 hypothetical protein FB458_2858 [Lapillicoccus jejuensis]